MQAGALAVQDHETRQGPPAHDMATTEEEEEEEINKWRCPMVVSHVSLSLVRVLFLCAGAQCGGLHAGVLGPVFAMLLGCFLSYHAPTFFAALRNLSYACGMEHACWFFAFFRWVFVDQFCDWSGVIGRTK